MQKTSIAKNLLPERIVSMQDALLRAQDEGRQVGREEEAARWREELPFATQAFDELYNLRDDYRGLLILINTTVSIAQNLSTEARNTVLRQSLQDVAGALAQTFTEWALRHAAYGHPLPADLAEHKDNYLIGIEQALNHNDGGRYLFELASRQSEIFKSIGEVRADINVGGRARGTGSATQLLLDMADPLWGTLRDAAEVGTHVLRELENIEPARRSRVQRQALNRLKYTQKDGKKHLQRSPGERGKFLRGLKNEVRDRAILPD